MPKVSVLICSQFHDDIFPLQLTEKLAKFFSEKKILVNVGTESISKDEILREKKFLDLYQEYQTLKTNKKPSTEEKSRINLLLQDLRKSHVTALHFEGIAQAKKLNPNLVFPEDTFPLFINDKANPIIGKRLEESAKMRLNTEHNLMELAEKNGGKYFFLEENSENLLKKITQELGKEEFERGFGITQLEINQRRHKIFNKYEQERTDNMAKSALENIALAQENSVILLSSVGPAHAERLQAKIALSLQQNGELQKTHEVEIKIVIFRPKNKKLAFESVIKDSKLVKDSSEITDFYSKNPVKILDSEKLDQDFYNIINILDSHVSEPAHVEIEKDLSEKQIEVLKKIGGEFVEISGTKFIKAPNHKLIAGTRDELGLGKKLITLKPSDPDFKEKQEVLNSGNFFSTASTFNPNQFLVTFAKEKLSEVEMFVSDFEKYKKPSTQLSPKAEASSSLSPNSPKKEVR